MKFVQFGIKLLIDSFEVVIGSLVDKALIYSMNKILKLQIIKEDSKRFCFLDQLIEFFVYFRGVEKVHLLDRVDVLIN